MMNFYSRTRRRVFANGMEAYFLPRPGCAVELECYIRTGSVNEGKFLGYGISHFLEHMLFQGCDGYAGQRAAEAVTALGGSINACTGHEYTMVNVRGPARYLEEFVRVVSAMVRTPELPEEKFRLEKQVILRECDRTHDQVSTRLIDELLRTMFALHPLRHPICGYPEMVKDCSCDMLRSYHRERYTPERCFWVLAGAFDPGAAAEILEKHCSEWKRAALFSPPLPEEPEPRSPRSGEFVFPDPLARLAVAVRLPKEESTLTDAAEVLFGVLGLGKSAKLVQTLEQRDRLAIEVSANCFSVCGNGLGAICASAKPAKLGTLEKQLFRELELVRAGKLDKRAVEREKRQKHVDLLHQTEDLRSIALNIGGAVLGGESPAECDRRIDRIAGLSLDDLHRAAEKFLEPGRFTVVRQLAAESKVKSAAAGTKTRRLTRVAPGLLLAGDDDAPIVHLALTLPGGTLFENRPAASTLCAAWLGSGTAELGEEAFWTKLEDCGAELAFNSGANSFGISLSAPRRRFHAALKLAGELLAGPRFDEGVFERERERLIENARCGEQNPVKSAVRRAKSALFGGHPYGRNNSGDAASLAALTPEDVRKFYRSMFRRDRISAAVSGNCSEAEALGWRDALFRELSFVGDAPRLPAPPEFPAASERLDFELPREQTAVVLALPGTCLGGAPDPRTDILIHTENGLASHLFHRVREDNALAYSVGMTMNGGFHRGCFVFYALTSDGGAETALRLLRDEAERLGSTGISEAEFAPAREAAAFEAESLLESGGALAETAALDLYYGMEPEAITGRGELLRGIRLKDFNALLKELFSGALAHSVAAVAHGTAAK